jgi:hypothetical protein
MPDSGRTDIAGLLARRRAVDADVERDAGATRGLRELRIWQAARLARTYDDLRREPQCAPAIEFFLSQVYGPQDFTRRDADLARASRILERTLPRAALEVLCAALELDALSRELDYAMLRALGEQALDAVTYARAWVEVGRPDARERQVALIGVLGERLGHIVRHAWIGGMLRLARGPADAAGFGALQDFLESGFEAFRRLGDPRAFLATIARRERELTARLFAGDPDPFGATAPPPPPPAGG